MCGFNFLKLAKLGWFNNALVLEILHGHFLRIGQLEFPQGQTIYSLISNDSSYYVSDEINRALTHSKAGLLSTCNEGPNLNNSNFFVTLGGDLSRHNGKHTIFGEISENWEMILGIATEPTDSLNRPYRNIRILETEIIHDPFEDPPGFADLCSRFVPSTPVAESDRIEDGEALTEISAEEQREYFQRMKAHRDAELLELLGDIPDAEARPSDKTLFVCKLNPITKADGLKIFFSRFGEVNNVHLVGDRQTGDSLCYAFVEFHTAREAENAYLKSQRVVLDGRPILVDFSQSVTGNHG
jgi:peptidyl-prolyl cis-trans isomerase-like 4